MSQTFRSNGNGGGGGRNPFAGTSPDQARFAHTLFAGGGSIPGVTSVLTPDQLDRLTDAVFEGVTNAYSQRQDWFRRRTGGGRFDPRRDVDDECGFPKDPLSSWDWWELHRRDALSQRVNEVLARETWRVQPEVYEKEKGAVTTAFEKSWQALGHLLRGERSHHKDVTNSHPAMSYLARLDEVCGIGRYGGLFFGLDDGRPASEPAAGWEETNSRPVKAPRVTGRKGDNGKPIVENGDAPPPVDLSRPYSLTVNREETKDRNLLYLRVFPEHLCQVAEVEGNQLSLRFGWPTYYNVTFNDPQDTVHGALVGPRGPRSGETSDFSAYETRVHWTRILHAADNLVSSEWAGTPRCHPVLNDLLTAQKPRWASGEGYWKACFTWLFLTTQPNYEGATVSRTDMRNLIENWMNGLQRANYLGGLTPESISPNVLDPTPFVEVAYNVVAMKLGIPVRILKGSERGELSSSQDSDEFADRLRGREDTHATPRLVAPFVDRGIGLGFLDPPGEDGFKVDWPDRAEQSEEVKARVFQTRMGAWSAYVSGGVDKLIPPKEALTLEGGYDEDEAEMILDAAEEYTAEQEEKALGQQKQAIDQGLAPDPTQPPPGKEKPGPDDMDDDARAIDLARKIRPSPSPKPATAPSANEWRDTDWFDYETLETLTENAARAKTGAAKEGSGKGGKGGKSKLSGGQWVTLDNGVKVYLKSGRVVVGPAPVKEALNKTGGTGVAGEGKGRKKTGSDASGNTGGKDGKGGGAHPGGKSSKIGEEPTSGKTSAVRYRSGDHAEKDLAPSARQWAEDTSDYFANRAVKAYAGTSDSFRINEHLRKGGDNPDLQAKADALAAVVDKARMPKSVEAYRTINPKTPEEKAQILQKFKDSVGKTYTDPAFTSTTANKAYSDEWAAKFKSDPIKMTVHVPQGSKAAYIPKDVTGRQEWEVLVQRGSKFKVKSVEGSNVVVELHGEG